MRVCCQLGCRCEANLTATAPAAIGQLQASSSPNNPTIAHRMNTALRRLTNVAAHLQRRILSTSAMNLDAAPQQAKPLNEIKSHQQYVAPPLDFNALKKSPLEQFSQWFDEAQAHGVPEPEAFSVATVDAATCTPSVRTVLLKQVDERGFCFFTNYQSRKGKEMGLSPDLDVQQGNKAAGSWYWRDMHRAVRVVGQVERISPEENSKYFHSRPVGSQIGAHASPQSQVVPDRAFLEERVQKFEDEFGIEHGSSVRKADDPKDQGKSVPVPKYWGGVRIVPQEVEFWVGRPNRLHDRARYTRTSESAEWIIERLAP